MRGNICFLVALAAASVFVHGASLPPVHAGPTVFFEENFDGVSLDPSRWSVSTNGYPSPAVSVGSGVVQMGQPGTTSQDFPYVSSLGTVFPATGNFQVEFAVQYGADAFNGDGLVLIGPNSERIFTLWHDSADGTSGPRLSLKGAGTYVVGNPSAQHAYRIHVTGNTASLFVDDVLQQSAPLDVRPMGLWFGHPTIGQTWFLPPGSSLEAHVDPVTGEVVSRWWSPSQWSPFALDYIRVSELPSTDFRALAEYWAPVLYQDTDSANPDRDFITNFDFDGNWDGIDNWYNQEIYFLIANVYYWVVETPTNWFIGYGLYHPRDWGDCPFQVGCHENDMEGVLLTIQKDGSSFGQFLLMNTQFHGGFLSYQDTGAAPSSTVTGGFATCLPEPCDVEFEGSSPIIYVEDKGHGVMGSQRWETEGFPGGDGVKYVYAGIAQEPTSGTQVGVGYDLKDVQELWDRRCDYLSPGGDQAFHSFGTFRGDFGIPDNQANAPWGWAGFFGARPNFFLDPAAGISSQFGGLGSFSSTYSDASFNPGPNDSAEVSCIPIELGDGVSLTYEQITGTGTTTSSTSSTGPLTPANYQPGTPAVYHDISTTSTFSGSIEVCSDYDESAYELEEGIRLFHYDGEAWDDTTTYLDTSNNRVCGVTLNLSPFHLAEIIPGQDLDGDACTNGSELGLDPTLGGLRDWTNPWDFYDVAGLSGATPDGYIDLLFDILGVIQHYSPQGDPPYDVAFDRGPTTGPNPWDMTAPDGVIDLLNDILGVIQQHSHDCR